MTIEELKSFLSNMTVIEACKLAVDLEDAWYGAASSLHRHYDGMAPE